MEEFNNGIKYASIEHEEAHLSPYDVDFEFSKEDFFMGNCNATLDIQFLVPSGKISLY